MQSISAHTLESTIIFNFYFYYMNPSLSYLFVKMSNPNTQEVSDMACARDVTEKTLGVSDEVAEAAENFDVMEVVEEILVEGADYKIVRFQTGLTYALCPYEVESVLDYRPGGYHPVHLGDVLGSYRVIHKLSYGISSTVWLARDLRVTDNTKYVALKDHPGSVIGTTVASACCADSLVRRWVKGMDPRTFAFPSIVLPSTGPTGLTSASYTQPWVPSSCSGCLSRMR